MTLSFRPQLPASSSMVLLVCIFRPLPASLGETSSHRRRMRSDVSRGGNQRRLGQNNPSHCIIVTVIHLPLEMCSQSLLRFKVSLVQLHFKHIALLWYKIDSSWQWCFAILTIKNIPAFPHAVLRRQPFNRIRGSFCLHTYYALGFEQFLAN